MKKLLFFKTLSAFTLLLPAAGADSRNPWNQVVLSSAQSKIAGDKAAKISFCLVTALPVGSAQAAGSAQHSASVPLHGRHRPMPGLQLNIRTGRRLEIQTRAQYFRTDWSGRFPVVLPPDGNSIPTTGYGVLNASARGILLKTGVAYFLTKGTIQPFVCGGVGGQFTFRSESETMIGNMSVPGGFDPPGARWSAYGGGGVRVICGRQILMEAGYTWGGRGGLVELGIGWRIGGG
ncbi:MAG: hypothetical protein KA165_09435 [Saprospiraceae bacterium]|nr:hypothetical protein [Saprospiraceae bacterium]